MVRHQARAALLPGSLHSAAFKVRWLHQAASHTSSLAAGMDLNMFEVMFVKLKASLLDLGVASAVGADRTSQWMDQAVRGPIRAPQIHMLLCRFGLR